MIAHALLLLALTICNPLQNASGPQNAATIRRGAQATDLAPRDFEWLSRAAEKARNENRDDEAIRLYQQALKLRPSWPEGLWYLSTLFYEKERYAEARDHLRRFVTLKPQSGPAWALLGMSEYQTREYQRALDHLQRAMFLGLGDRKEMIQSMFYFVAVLRTRSEQYTDSMDLLIAMVKSGSPTEALVEPLGLAALRMPFLPAEIPSDRRELVQLAGRVTLAIEAQRQEEAEALFRRMTEQYSNEPGVHFLFGAFLMDMRPADGMRELQRELEISPTNVAARLRLAEQFIKDEKLDQALALAEEAVKLEPANSAAHLILGEALAANGDLGRGIQELEKAREQTPERVRTHWDLLRAYTATGRTEDAKREKETIESLSSPAARP
jgi:tetratricopeptide (TPR) repeat protein